MPAQYQKLWEYPENPVCYLTYSYHMQYVLMDGGIYTRIYTEAQ